MLLVHSVYIKEKKNYSKKRAKLLFAWYIFTTLALQIEVVGLGPEQCTYCQRPFFPRANPTIFEFTATTPAL
jgi:hypothetical protein